MKIFMHRRGESLRSFYFMLKSFLAWIGAYEIKLHKRRRLL